MGAPSAGLHCEAVSRAMGIFEAVPVARDCLFVSGPGDEAKLLTSTSTFATEQATLKEAREMLVAACLVDQISEEYLDTLLAEAWQRQEPPLVLAARVLRRVCAMAD
jgi:hypothetical protein